MATWLKEGKQPPQDVLRIIEGLFHRVASPIYLGAVSLHIGWSLARTEEMLHVMVDRGLIRKLSPVEKAQRLLPAEGDIYGLVGRPVLAKAWR